MEMRKMMSGDERDGKEDELLIVASFPWKGQSVEKKRSYQKEVEMRS